MNRKVVIVIVIMLTLLLATQAYADKIGIDNFNTADQDICDPAGSGCSDAATQTSVAYASAIGGRRDMTVTRTGGPGSVAAETGFGSDLVSYQQDAITTGTWELVWDGDSNPAVLDPVGLGGVDLTDGATNAQFYFGSFTNDQAFTLRIDVYTDAGNASRIDDAQPIQTGATVTVPFSSFSTLLGAGADFTNVGAIRVFIDGSAIASLDVSFDYFTADDLTPTAISLESVGASDQSALFPLALGALLLVLFSAGLVYNRKRQAV